MLGEPMELVLHVTDPDAWEAARARGSLPRGGEPAATGAPITGAAGAFLHCCFDDQLGGVLDRFYADAMGPLLVLEIDASALDVRVEAASDGAGDFPHLHQDLPVEAVVDLRRLERRDGDWTPTA